MAGRFLYRYVFRRTSTFVLSVVVTSMFFERAYDQACEAIFEWVNEGRLWAHIKHRYNDVPQKLSQRREPVPGGTRKELNSPIQSNKDTSKHQQK